MGRYRLCNPLGRDRLVVRANQTKGLTGSSAAYPGWYQDIFGGQAACLATPWAIISEMWDDTEMKRSTRSYPFHNCTHLKSTVDYLINTRKIEFLNNPEVPPYFATEYSPGYRVLGADYSGLPTTFDWPGMYNELSSKLNGVTSSQTLLPVSIAEMAETVRMIKNPFGLLKKDWRKIAGHSTPASLAKEGANLWLEYQYGWKAFYGDLKSVAKTGKELLNTPPTGSGGLSSRLGASRHGSTSMGSWGYSSGSGSNYFPPDYSAGPYSNAGDGGARCRQIGAGVTASVGCYQVNNLAQRLSKTQRTLRAWGLDAGSMLDVMWELTPFSFVVDWFVDTKGLWSLPFSMWRLNRPDVRDLHYTIKKVARVQVQAVFPTVFQMVEPWGSHPGIAPTSSSGELGSAYPQLSEYYRVSGLPSFSSFLGALNTQGLSSTRTVSGISLAVQKMFR